MRPQVTGPAVDAVAAMGAWPSPQTLPPELRGFARQVRRMGGTFDGIWGVLAHCPAWVFAVSRAAAAGGDDPGARAALGLLLSEAAVVTGVPAPGPLAFRRHPRAPGAVIEPPPLSPSQALLVAQDGRPADPTAEVARVLVATAFAPDTSDRLPRRVRIRLAAVTVPPHHLERWLDGLAPLLPAPPPAPAPHVLAEILVRALPTPLSVAPSPVDGWTGAVPTALSVDALLSALALRLALRENGVLAPACSVPEAATYAGPAPIAPPAVSRAAPARASMPS